MVSSNTCWHLDLGQIDYQSAWTLQEQILALRTEGLIQHDVVLFLEHFPVFTLGRRGGHENLLVSESFLRTKDVSLYQVERGGDITYHGPGQLVVYPIVNLNIQKLGVLPFVENLEEIMIRCAAEHGINATRNPKNRGIWVGEKKMGSIGIAVRRGITFHGMALNGKMDLTPFSWITPCGLKDIAVTCMDRETPNAISMSQIRRSVFQHWETVFNVRLNSMAMSDMRSLIDRSRPAAN